MKKIIFTILPPIPFHYASPRLAFAGAQRRFVVFVFATTFLLSSVQRALSQGNNYEGPIGVTGIFNGNVTTGCSYDPLTHSGHREVTDIVVPGSIGKYPLKMTRYFNSRQQYYAQNAIGLGPGWAHEYSWLLYTAGEKVVSPHGNVYDFHCGPPVGVSEAWDDGIQGPHASGGVWRLADGGKVHFDGNRQVDYIEDPYGFRTTIEYQNGRRWRVTEPGGRCLVFAYDATDPWDNTPLLTKVEAYDYYNGHRIDWISYTYQQYNPIDPLPQGRQPKMMLRTVTYSDVTSATYDYTYDNVREDPSHGSFKMYPLLQRCDDVRYNGPMRTIVYDYQNGGPHGAITAEKYPNVGAVSAIAEESHGLQEAPYVFTETRGDGPTRQFTYTRFSHCQGAECGPCEDVQNNNPPQQMLEEYTDFQGHKTWVGYDERYGHWYVNSVTDARGTGRGDPNHTVLYQRGEPPPNGIGEILSITYPNNMGNVQYSYYRNGNTYDPHYLASITDERGNKTVHTHDPNTHKILQTDYIDVNDNNALLARETFTYCDQADPFQCSNNPLGQIKTHRLKNGAYVHYRYDPRGLLLDKWEPTWTSNADDAEPKTHYEYYTSGPWTDRVKTVTGPPPNWAYTGGPTSETYEYDRVLGANGITDLNGAAVSGRGLVTKITHADGKFQRFAYDAYGNKRWEDNELRKATSYTYDEYNRLRNVTRPLNGVTTYTYNPTNGGGSPLSDTTNNPDTVSVRTSATTPDIVTKHVYDENFRKTSSTAAFGTGTAATTWFHYDAVGNQDYVTDPRGSSTPSAAWTTYTDYDNRNRKWQVREPLGRVTQFYYDDKINVTRIVRNDNTGNVTETKAYDGMNRVLTDTVPKEQGVDIVTRFRYYPWNVHSAGLLWNVTDGNGNIYQFEYDPSGLKTKMTYPDYSTRSWTYDDAHNLKSRTTVNREIQNFAYDNRNRKTGEWWDEFPADGEWRVFGYDDANHLTLATNGTGNPWTNFIADIRRSYDDAGRLTQDQQKVYVNGVPITKNVNYPSHDDEGKLLRMYVYSAAPAYDYTFSYDGMGRFEKIYVTNSFQIFQYHYDPASNETQRDNLFDGVSQIYPRDELNRMTKVELQGASSAAREVYDYYTIGRLRTVTRQDNKQDQFVYYLDGELKQVTYGVAATPPPMPSPTPTPPGGQVATPTFRPDGTYYSACAYSYTFNVIISTTTSGAQISYTTDGSTPTQNHGTVIANGGIASFLVQAGHTTTLKAIGFKTGMTNSNIKSADYSFERDCGQGPNAVGYPLDNAGFAPAGPVAPDLSGTYTYTLDKAGNRTAVNGVNYTPNSINQYTSVGGRAITNGPDHAIQVDYGFTYHYMRDQELKQITAPGPPSFTYDFAYDALGRCVKRAVNNDPAYTTYYIYDGDKPILEYNANNALVGFNVYGKGVDEIVERGAYGTDNQWHWYFLNQDHEGSVTYLTDANGTIIEKYRYDIFGTPNFYNGGGTQISTTAYNNRFLFTGREYLGAWIYDYRARLYNANYGRFISEDPKLSDAGDYNLFRYCHNDPIDLTDPMGLTGEATGLLESGTHDRLWDMTQWFDRSNLIQGNFAGFGLSLGLTDREGEGKITQKASEGVTLRPRYRQMNEEKLAGLDPRFAPMARRFVDAANAEVNPQGLEVRISHGTRSLAEQAELYRRYLADRKYKAAAPGRSAHNYGMAIDIAVIRGSALIDTPSIWARVGRLGESLGLRWGHGFDDDDHFQHPGIPMSGTQLLRLHSQGRDVLTGEPLN